MVDTRTRDPKKKKPPQGANVPSMDFTRTQVRRSRRNAIVETGKLVIRHPSQNTAVSDAHDEVIRAPPVVDHCLPVLVVDADRSSPF